WPARGEGALGSLAALRPQGVLPNSRFCDADVRLGSRTTLQPRAWIVRRRCLTLQTLRRCVGADLLPHRSRGDDLDVEFAPYASPARSKRSLATGRLMFVGLRANGIALVR